MRNKAFKFRIYPNKNQATLIKKACGCRRFIYNWGLDLKQKAYLQKNKLTAIDLANLLPDLKKENIWLKEVNSQSLQTTLRDLDIAFTRFFKKLGKYPTKKKKGKTKDSFQIPQHFKIDMDNKKIILPKLGNIKVVLHREIIGNPCSITISMSKSGKFFASILTEQDIENPELKPIDPNTTIGIDMGIKSFAVCSDGRKFDNPKYLRKAMLKVKFLARQHSRKQKGGKNREKARKLLAIQYEKITNQRKDFIHKVSHQIANENQVGTICIENLNIKGMMQNHKLAGAISDCSWSEFFTFLKYKCDWRGIRIVEIGRFEPSSRLCPCGFKNDDLKLTDREWICPKCGLIHDRDLLAANNIKTFGLAKIVDLKDNTAVGITVAKLGELPGSNLELRTKKPLALC